MKILVAYDGTLQSKTSLAYGIRKAAETGGDVLVLHVFQTSLFVDYEAGLPALDIARAESQQHILEAKKIIEHSANQVPVRMISVEGNPGELIVQYARDEKVDFVIISPRYEAAAKSVSCSVQVIPGTILVPVDNSEAPFETIDAVIREAVMTKSTVVILGIIPVHLYSRWERNEINTVRKETVRVIAALKKVLNANGIDATDSVRAGYPDEEILKAVDDYSATMIMLPAGGATPSELSKAAAVLLDEPRRLNHAVVLFPMVRAA